MTGTGGDDRRDFLGALDEGDRVGRIDRMVGLILAMMLANRRRRTQPLTKKIAEFSDQGGIGGSAGKNGFGGHCDFLDLSFCRSLAARWIGRHARRTAKSFEVICFF